MATKKAAAGLVRYAALLRGVSPMNCKMPELARAFEAVGFADVRTLLSSGNVVFSARAASEAALAKKAEAAMNEHLGRSFATIVRPVDELRELLAADPYRKFRLAPGSKRVVTFLPAPVAAKLKLPIEMEGARILVVTERVALSAYVPSPGDPVFMRLLEKTFGKSITTRTWETVQKITLK